MFLIVPIVIWARLQRKRHNLSQALIAIIVVLIITAGTIKVFGF